jgi:hypothetical protein
MTRAGLGDHRRVPSTRRGGVHRYHDAADVHFCGNHIRQLSTGFSKSDIEPSPVEIGLTRRLDADPELGITQPVAK